MSRDDRQPIPDAELEAFEEAIGDLGDRVTEFLGKGIDHTPEEIEATVDELPKPNPIDDEELTHQRTGRFPVWMG